MPHVDVDMDGLFACMWLSLAINGHMWPFNNIIDWAANDRQLPAHNCKSLVTAETGQPNTEYR